MSRSQDLWIKIMKRRKSRRVVFRITQRKARPARGIRGRKIMGRLVKILMILMGYWNKRRPLRAIRKSMSSLGTQDLCLLSQFLSVISTC